MFALTLQSNVRNGVHLPTSAIVTSRSVLPPQVDIVSLATHVGYAPRAALPAKSHFDPERKFGLVTKFDILIRAKRNGLALQLLFRFEVGSLGDRLMSSTPE